MEKFSCKDCPAGFTKKRNLVRHIRQKHGDEKGPYLCDDCGASFLRHDNLVGHVREKHEGTTPQYLCEKCGLGFSRSTYLKRHRSDAVSVRKDARKRKSERKAEGGEKRKKRDRAALNNPLQPDIIQDNLEGEDVDNIISSIDEEGVREIYRNHWTSLCTHYREGPNHSHYTFRWVLQTVPCWEQWLSSVFCRQEKRFKLNLSHSFVLFNREEKEFRFFHASKNNARVWDKPKTISRFRDIGEIVKDLKAVDTLEYARQQRPNTKWTVHSIASKTFYVDKLPDLPIGGCCSEDPMPSHVLENKAFVPFHIDTNHGKQLNDRLCFFRCLAAHYTEERRCVEARAQALFRQWTDTPIDEFEGVKLYELDELEDVFKVDIDVFEFKYDPPCLVPHRRSSYNHGDVLHLLLVHGCHFCYIQDIDAAASAFGCKKCGKQYKERLRLARHEKTCAGDEIKRYYPGGVYHPNLTPLEVLADEGVPLPVVGFNSGRYDINVIKPYFVHRFLIDPNGHGTTDEDDSDFRQKRQRFVIKKNNEFMAISTPMLKFLDITNFIAPGFSYAKYLAAYEVEEQKGFFPYEYITSLEKLEETSLPPREAFYSSLRNSELSQQNYDYLCQVWRDNGMRNLRDLLVWYNNKDTRPFIEALEKQCEFYKTLGLDMLKDAVSVPGLTLRYLFKTMPQNHFFSLIRVKDKDLHEELRKQIVGGSSIIFHRYHEKGITKLRGENEKQLGNRRIRVDGWDARNNTVYQFHGCFFHGHECHKTERCGDVNLVNGKSFQELREATTEISQYLSEEVGVKVIEMYECEWAQMKEDNKEIVDFINTRLPPSLPTSSTMTKASILHDIFDGYLFGLVRCDIKVPGSLQNHFSEMPPIFKNKEVSRNDIGSFMCNFADEHKLLQQPRRTLIGSFIGKNIFLATPLLRCYLEHGLIVDEIYEVVEYTPTRCFQGFADTFPRTEGEVI
ncbi:Zinc finger protein 546-like [Plakobranchus ocellatus]|uniref:Zinc finger protein 546-like n=1 Tax=Plakobranchus ocellatus TaxID=259542 RepID=A0AAV3Z711_9GAST|nr:Zinc finger protein 546-like [Plakobranchus ocellatus]